MNTQAPLRRIVRFGVFEVDLQEGELRRAGLRLKLGPQPFHVLQVMLERPGEVVTRDELRERLWPANTFVDYELALKKCVNRIREALGDSADSPRFVETVPRRGYRFIASVEEVGVTNGRPSNGSRGEASTIIPPVLVPESLTVPAAKHPTRRGVAITGLRFLAGALGLAVVIVAVLAARSWMLTAAPQVVRVTQLTNDGEPKAPYPLVTDRERIYFNEGGRGAFRIAEVSVKGGQTGTVSTNLVNPAISDSAPDGSSLLALTGVVGPAYPMWLIPLPAGEPRRVGDAEASAGPVSSGPVFFPDERVAFTRGNALFVAEKEGSNLRKLAEFTRPAFFPSVSPDGTRVEVTLCCDGTPPALQEVGLATPERSHEVRGLPSQVLGPHCCVWTPDGRYLVFSSVSDGRSDLWAFPERSGIFRRVRAPVRLTNGPVSYTGAVVSRDGKQIFAIGSTLRGELVRYDEKSREYVPYLSGISATDPTFSRDGKWVAYRSFPDLSLWRSRTDGSDRLQLTYSPTKVSDPYISHDGTRVTFATANGVFIVGVNGGTPQKVENSREHGCDNGSWSPDDKLLLLGCSIPIEIRIFDLRSGKTLVVPGSGGSRGGQWVDQHTLVVASKGNTSLMTVDLTKRKWAELASSGPFLNWFVSPDGKHIYCTTRGADPKLLRIRFSDHRVETISSLKGLRRVTDPDTEYTQVNVAPDGSPLFTRDIGIQEIYALTLKW